MQGLVIYNGSSKTKKVQDCAKRIFDEAVLQNIDMQIVRNDEIINLIDSDNEINLIYPKEIKKPDFVIGWDKDITLLEKIEKTGIRCFNSSNSIRICDDKSIMHSKLIGSKLKTPKTILSPLVFNTYDFSKEYYQNIVDLLGDEFILKENKGSFGMQVYKIDSFDDFIKITKQIGNHGFLMQENIKTSKGKDIRVSIVGNEVIGCMLRTNENDFRANITLGGTATMFTPPKEVIDLALEVHKLLELDFCGVDILLGKNDEPILCEVNSNLNFLSFEKASNINFAKKIVDYIKDKQTNG